MEGGSSTFGYGGSLHVKSGKSKSQSSGSIVVNSEDAGYSGVSGGIELYTGHSSRGNSGHFTVDTGNSTVGSSGDIRLAVGTGHGTDNDAGVVEVHAGNSIDSTGSYGGRITLKTGYSDNGHSGSLNMITAEGGHMQGNSGPIFIGSSEARNGNTGSIALHSGDAIDGRAGAIDIAVGKSSSSTLIRDEKDGKTGNSISLRAGEAKDPLSAGGKININGGEGTNESLFGGGKGGRVEVTGKKSTILFDFFL